MSPDHESAELDLSISPEEMLAIRDGVRARLVKQVHTLRIESRVYRKGACEREWRQCEREIERTLKMIKSLEDPLDAGLTWLPRRGEADPEP